jgi:bilirubin oxidase
MVAHPFHIHDVQFFLIDRSGNTPPAEELGRKDVVLVPPFDSVMFITKFEDFADSITPFMYHCHILMHEDDGMMGQFVVMPPTSVGINEVENSNKFISIYPNPTNGIVNITTNGINELKIYNVLGELIYTETKIGTNELQINTSQWSKGIYTIQVNSKGNTINKKLIVN